MKRDIALLLVGLAVLAVMGLPSLVYPFGRDQAMFAYIGDRWRHGAWPYRDAWDIKPPAVFWIYSVAMDCFGRNMAAPRWADLLAVLLAAAGIFAIVRRCGNASLACFAMVLFGLAYFGSFGYWDTAQAESFAAPPAIWMVYSLLRGANRGRKVWWIAAGLCLGALILLKTIFVLFGLLAGVAWMQSRATKGSRNPGAFDLPLFALAAMVLPGACVLAFVCHGALPQLAELFAAQAGYAHGQHTNFWPRLVIAATGMLAHPALILCGLGALSGFFFRQLRSKPDLTIVSVWLGLAVLLAAVQGRLYYYHWIPALPALAILASRPLSRAWSAVRQRPSLAGRALGTACVGGALLFPVVLYVPAMFPSWRVATQQLRTADYYSQFYGPANFSILDNVRAATYIREHSRPGETALVLAFEPAIYFLADRACPTRHLSTAPLTGEVQIPFKLRGRWLEEQRADISRDPPRFMVLIDGVQRDGIQFHGADSFEFAGHRFDRAKVEGQFRLFERNDGGLARIHGEEHHTIRNRQPMGRMIL